ncbi:MAG: putative Ig domain-containing protein [Chitinivibrionales bacterium]|nr:putative Ig domain-containing protein [Chitinivibrionales bacterium]
MNSRNYISAKKPHATFIKDTLTAFLYDTIAIQIACADTTVGGKKGAIKEFYFSWEGDTALADSVNGTDADTFVFKKAFPPGVRTARVSALDFEGALSGPDSAVLVIMLSRPRIMDMALPHSAPKSARFTISLVATDTGGVIQSYLWALNGTDYSDTTAVDSFTTSFNDTGEKEIGVKVKDNKGIVSAADTLHVVIFEIPDTTPPSMAFLSPQDNDSVGIPDIIAYLQAKDENGVAAVVINTVPLTQSQDVWKGPITLAPGKNTLIATATDARNNSATAQISVFYITAAIDKTPPVIIFKVPAHRQDTILTPACAVQLLALDESGVAAITLAGALMAKSPADSSFGSTVQLSDGKNSFVIQAVDTKGNIGYDTLIIFHPAKVAPVLVSPGNKVALVNQNVSFQLVASDMDVSQVLTFSMAHAPGGATLTGNQFNWTPAYSQIGQYQVTFYVRDNGTPPKADSATITLSALKTNIAPVLANPGNKTINENQNLAFDLSATDINGDSIRYSMTTPPAGATLTQAHFNWTPTYLQAGGYTVKFFVTDNGTPPMSDSQTIAITVNNVNVPPSLANPGNKTVNVNQLLQFSLSATDVDGDVIGYFLSGAPPGANLAGANFTWTPTFQQAGSYTVKFYARDNGTPPMSDSQSITISVTAAIPAVPVIAGVTAGNKSVRVSWASVPNATSYNLYYQAGSSVVKGTATVITGATTPQAVNALTNGTQYAFAVTAVNTSGESNLSAVQTAVPIRP